ncbi:MAG: acyl--CoA ligase [Archaeoglobus sp.]|uniref:class I adenylate-forming enzyme family protein n=1 Tax=Archaeoglobus sp. TaxID=1872626 RepID=UPI001DBDC800|nr:class I adenylate-forming enzyme family protein [Archaeoglobus sp.]MBO8181047.1 acyl--CoA ligase [Archaeoglobus sp.]
MVVLYGKDLVDKYVLEGWWDNVTLSERFRRNCKKNPDRIAVVDPPNKEELVGFKPERLTYAELEDFSDRLASFLLDNGVFKDSCVLVQLPNTVELIASYFATWKASAFISPVPMQWREHELSQVCRILQPKVLITAETFKGHDHARMAGKIKEAFPSIEKVIPYSQLYEICRNYRIREDLDEASSYLSGNDVAVVQWTSGTEAEPKACPLTHNNWGFLQFLYNGEKYRGGLLSDGDVIMNPAPIVNMTGIGVGLVPWIMCSGTFVLHHPFDPMLYVRQLIEEGVNFTLAPPAVVVAILKHPMASQLTFDKLKYFAQGSAPPPPWTFAELKNRGIEPMNIWGQNEGTGLFSYDKTIPDLEKRARAFPVPEKVSELPFFRAIEIKVVDESGNELKEPGSVGELCYRSPLTMPCYYRQPELTRKSFDAEGFFHTGDLFEIVDESSIAFFDRKKDIIIRGGFNVSSAEVEDIVKKHPNVMDAAAVGVPDERLGERVGLFVVPKPGTTITLDDIKKFMEENGVAIYKWPEAVVVVDEIPRNPVGKVLKSRLRKEIVERMREGS